jgi:hypothetical protein
MKPFLFDSRKHLIPRGSSPIWTTPLGKVSFGVSISPGLFPGSFKSFRTRGGAKFFIWKSPNWIAELIFFKSDLTDTNPKPRSSFGLVFRFLPIEHFESISFYLAWQEIQPNLYSDFDDGENYTSREWESSKYVVSMGTQDNMFLYKRTQFDNLFPNELEDCDLVKEIKGWGYLYIDAIRNSHDELSICLPRWSPGQMIEIPFAVSWDFGNQMILGNFSTVLAVDETLRHYDETLYRKINGE